MDGLRKAGAGMVAKARFFPFTRPVERDPSLRLRVTPAGSSIRDHAVMLSRAKHLEAERDRTFAAAQGDTGRRLRVMFIARRSVAAAPGLGAPCSPCCQASA